MDCLSSLPSVAGTAFANYAVLSASTIQHGPPIMGAIKLRAVYLVNYCSKWKFNLI